MWRLDALIDLRFAFGICPSIYGGRPRDTVAVRRYAGFLSDSARWDDFPWRDDDIVITTPAKCGTTWMQTIVAMLVVGRVDFDTPLGELSPWLDMLTRPKAEVFELLERQSHRRFIKTHTPLDGLPWQDGVTYLCVVRHPLDAMLSNADHSDNQDRDRTAALREAVAGPYDPPAQTQDPPTDRADYLRWWIANDQPPKGTGTANLGEFAHQAVTYWSRRTEPNVHLFHYEDLRTDLEGEMHRVASALNASIEPERWPTFVQGAGFEAMRRQAMTLAPDANMGLWRSPEAFFKEARSNAWTGLLSEDDLADYEQRFASLAGDQVVAWVHHGRAALDTSA